MKYCLFVLIPFLFISCEGGEEIDRSENVDSKDDSSDFVTEVIEIETLFDRTNFEFESGYNLLKELNICDTTDIVPKECSACSSRYFKFFQLDRNKSIENSFLLQIRANTVLKDVGIPLPIRNLIAFERENGELVMVNGFRGNLIEKRTVPSGYDDLLIRFFLPKENAFFNCSFVWEDKKYRFKEVEVIDESGIGGKVMPEFRDSMSVVVYQLLKDNQMLF